MKTEDLAVQSALDRAHTDAMLCIEIGGDEAEYARQELNCDLIVLVEQMDPRLGHLLERALHVCRAQLGDIRKDIQADAAWEMA